MGVSRLTSYTIANRDDIVATAGGPDENGLYAGLITLGPNEQYRILLSTHSVYESADQAKKEMTTAIANIRQAAQEELKGRDPVTAVLGDSEEAKVVRQVVDGSKS